MGLEPRALALQGLIRLLGLGVMENDGVRENHRATSDVHAIGMMMEYDYRRGGIVTSGEWEMARKGCRGSRSN